MDAYTSAQVELLAMDCPITVYDRKDRKGKGKKLPKPKVKDVIDSGKRWEEKYKGKDAKVELDLSGFSLK